MKIDTPSRDIAVAMHCWAADIRHFRTKPYAPKTNGKDAGFNQAPGADRLTRTADIPDGRGDDLAFWTKL